MYVVERAVGIENEGEWLDDGSCAMWMLRHFAPNQRIRAERGRRFQPHARAVLGFQPMCANKQTGRSVERILWTRGDQDWLRPVAASD